jgi:hypothetical protein
VRDCAVAAVPVVAGWLPQVTLPSFQVAPGRKAWSVRPSLYSVAHCSLSCASVAFFWPLAGLAYSLRLAATHSLI